MILDKWIIYSMPRSIVNIAVESYLTGSSASLWWSAQTHGVAKSTVSERKRSQKLLKDALHDRLKLLLQEESTLAGNVSQQTLLGYPLDGTILQLLATIILEQRTTLFSRKLPNRWGKHWHEAFFGWFLNLVVEQTTVMERLYINGAMYPCPELYYELLKEMLELLIKENI